MNRPPECSDRPVSTMPGHTVSCSAGEACDDCNELATVRVQGETDSFGCEWIYLCAPCHGKFKLELEEHKKEARIGTCDWCRDAATDLRQHRDLDEGSAGRIYRVCGKCISEENERAREELEESLRDDPYPNYDFEDSLDDLDPEPDFVEWETP